ncbi:tRNA glutamyl-Q(34) synthetase GluQRS [Neisseria sp. Ec49-e6-T10]|uniref:tRNA glutamyl-Q(34) synthetase GluQRS n=1 Tax=Neisseria sp. Ec49-e6-T10 TaxID=3140744 RepID=UPI003EBAD9F3
MSVYIGRFAPSPTGALHLGSLLAALGSFLDAKSHQGKWLVRIEDVDTTRTVKNADTQILKTLEAFGLLWDDQVVYQSQRTEAYQEALTYLQQHQQVYPCFCSRKKVKEEGKEGIDGAIYSGHCRLFLSNDFTQPHSWRFYVPKGVFGFEDRILGTYNQNVHEQIGDFILKRRDHLWAYQLAVVVDDAWQNITHIVRGQDLLISTPRQIALQQALGLPTPQYAHLPLLVNNHGQKLSKQTLAPALNLHETLTLLKKVLPFLGLLPPNGIDTIDDLLQWAITHWHITQVPKQAFEIR